MEKSDEQVFNKGGLSLSLHEPVPADGLKTMSIGERREWEKQETTDHATESLSESRHLVDAPSFTGN